MDFNIVLLPGDGIGPEVVGQAVRVLTAAAQADAPACISTNTHRRCSIDKFGTAPDG